MTFSRIYISITLMISFQVYGQDDKLDSLGIYEKLIMQADSAFAIAKNHTLALKKYELAHEFKPNEIYPQDKIIEVLHYIKYETYSVLISSGNTCFKNNKYDNALNFYMKAQELFPNKPLTENHKLVIKMLNQKQK